MVSRDLSCAYLCNDKVLLWCRSCTWYGESGFPVEVRSLAIVSSEHVVIYNADRTQSFCICATEWSYRGENYTNLGELLYFMIILTLSHKVTPL